MMNKETIKQFLKLDLKKVVVASIFIILSFSSNLPLSYFSGYSLQTDLTYEYEFVFYGCEIHTCHFLLPYNNSKEADYVNFYLVNSFFNLIFWYLISCLIIFYYDKFKTKK